VLISVIVFTDTISSRRDCNHLFWLSYFTYLKLLRDNRNAEFRELLRAIQANREPTHIILHLNHHVLSLDGFAAADTIAHSLALLNVASIRSRLHFRGKLCVAHDYLICLQRASTRNNLTL
jgi:hypothetical protein